MNPQLKTVIGLGALIALAACVEQRAGTEVTIDLVPPSSSIEFVTDSDEEISLTEAWLTLGGMELVPCDTISSSLAQWFKKLSPIGTAHAHIPGSPTRIGAPLVFDLLSQDTSINFGVLSPPVGDYCSLDVWVIPADDDSRGLPEDTRMDTRTFLLTGAWGTGTSDATEELRILGADSAIVNLGFDSPIVLNRESPSAQINLGFTLPSFFSQLELQATSGVEQSRAVMENIPLSFELSVNLPEK